MQFDADVSVSGKSLESSGHSGQIYISIVATREYESHRGLSLDHDSRSLSQTQSDTVRSKVNTPPLFTYIPSGTSPNICSLAHHINNQGLPERKLSNQKVCVWNMLQWHYSSVYL